ncbi:hypothetical protein BC628DRAFT_1332619 [Trametes gibbosa]|nr:hypothetical protein BC628DRAFT_1332619 [Trametes gibbosa]
MYVPGGRGRGRGSRGGGGGGRGRGDDWDSRDSWDRGERADRFAPQQHKQSDHAAGWGTESYEAPRWENSSAPARDAHQAETSAAGGKLVWGPPPPSASTTAKVPDRGAPPASAWGEPTADWDAPMAPTPAGIRVPPTAGSWGGSTAEQKSPDQEKKTAEETIWPSSSKAKNVEATPTPQWAIGTPRTPHSPNQSPAQRMQTADPRRRPQVSTTASKAAGSAMSPPGEVTPSATSREMRKPEIRLLSNGVPAFVSTAGPSGSSSSKSNPFSFPTYTPAEKMEIVQEPAAHDVGREVDMTETLDTPVSPTVSNLPTTALEQWKSYTRILTKAVALSLDLAALRELSERQRALQHSAQFKEGSARSMAAANARLTRVRADTDAKLGRTKRRFDACINNLMCLPVTGPPAVGDPPRSQEIAEVDEWAGGLRAWMGGVSPVVQQHLETERARARAREEAETAARAKAVAEAARREEARERVAAVTSRTGRLEEGLTDLELQMEELQIAHINTEEIVVRVLEDRLGVSLAAPELSQRSIEEGEVPPPPPMTRAELAERCTDLDRQLKECVQRIAETQRHIEEEISKNTAKKIAYHELASEQARMELRLRDLLDKKEASSPSVQAIYEEIQALRAELEAYKEREPPPPPPVITFDQVAAHIVPILRPELYGALEDAVGAVRRGVDEALTKQQEDICLQVWQAFQPVLRLIRKVSQIQDRDPGLFMPPPPPPVQFLQPS